jgi:hypothetical protein
LIFQKKITLQSDLDIPVKNVVRYSFVINNFLSFSLPLVL